MSKTKNTTGAHKPLFMWAGGKRKMLKHYTSLFPPSITSYVEPFFGGGALFSALDFQSASINDINWEIIDLYNWIKSDPQKLFRETKRLETSYLELSKVDRKTLYYDLRDKYWQSEAQSIKTSALLFFLLKTGFNGIWQACVASKGRFGTPCGLLDHTKPFIVEAEVFAWAEKLSRTIITKTNYAEVSVATDSFVFCDPPYRDSFTNYNTTFGDIEQLSLLAWARKQAKETKSEVWVSNRDSADGFWETNASDAVIHRFPVTYTAGRRKKTIEAGISYFAAKPAIEVLIIFKG